MSKSRQVRAARDPARRQQRQSDALPGNTMGFNFICLQRPSTPVGTHLGPEDLEQKPWTGLVTDSHVQFVGNLHPSYSQQNVIITAAKAKTTHHPPRLRLIVYPAP